MILLTSTRVNPAEAQRERARERVRNRARERVRERERERMIEREREKVRETVFVSYVYMRTGVPNFPGPPHLCDQKRDV